MDQERIYAYDFSDMVDPKRAIMGPTLKYVYSEYFRLAEHTMIRSGLDVADRLYWAGFSGETIQQRSPSLSFDRGLHVSRILVKSFLALPWAWHISGKHILLIGRQ